MKDAVFGVIAYHHALHDYGFTEEKNIKNAVKVALSHISVYSKGGPPTAGSPLTM